MAPRSTLTRRTWWRQRRRGAGAGEGLQVRRSARGGAGAFRSARRRRRGPCPPPPPPRPRAAPRTCLSPPPVSSSLPRVDGTYSSAMIDDVCPWRAGEERDGGGARPRERAAQRRRRAARAAPRRNWVARACRRACGGSRPQQRPRCRCARRAACAAHRAPRRAAPRRAPLLHAPRAPALRPHRVEAAQQAPVLAAVHVEDAVAARRGEEGAAAIEGQVIHGRGVALLEAAVQRQLAHQALRRPPAPYGLGPAAPRPQAALAAQEQRVHGVQTGADRPRQRMWWNAMYQVPGAHGGTGRARQRGDPDRRWAGSRPSRPVSRQKLAWKLKTNRSRRRPHILLAMGAGDWDFDGRSPYEVLGLVKGAESSADDIKKVRRVPRARRHGAARAARAPLALRCAAARPLRRELAAAQARPQ
jgi:hypothetical protein